MTEEKAVNVLLHKGVKFKVRVRLFGKNLNIPFRIRPLYLGTILHLSRQRQKLQQVSEDGELLWEMFEKAQNVKIFARCVAISTLNNRLKIFLFTYPLSWLFLSRLTVKDMHDLMTVVVSQMNAKGFFLTTALIKGIQIVDRTRGTSPKKQSGEPSGKSPKS